MGDEWDQYKVASSKGQDEWDAFKVSADKPATFRDALKHQGFLDSAWNTIYGTVSMPVHALGAATREVYQNMAMGPEAARKRANQPTERELEIQELQEHGTPAQRREYAKDYLLKNIPFASTVYKAFQGNVGGAAGDVAGMAVLAPFARGRESGETAIGKSAKQAASSAAGKIPEVHPVAKFIAKRIPGVGTALDVLELIRKQYGNADGGKPSEPFRPNPAIAAKTRFGGPTEPEYGPPGKPIPRRGLSPKEPEPEPEPKAPEPFKPNPAIAAKMKYGGPSPPESMSSRNPSARMGVNRAMEPQVEPKSKETTQTAPATPNNIAATIAQKLKQSGVTVDTLAAQGKQESIRFAKLAKEMGTTPKAIMEELGKLKRKPSPKNTLKGPA